MAFAFRIARVPAFKIWQFTRLVFRDLFPRRARSLLAQKVIPELPVRLVRKARRVTLVHLELLARKVQLAQRAQLVRKARRVTLVHLELPARRVPQGRSVQPVHRVHKVRQAQAAGIGTATAERMTTKIRTAMVSSMCLIVWVHRGRQVRRELPVRKVRRARQVRQAQRAIQASLAQLVQQAHRVHKAQQASVAGIVTTMAARMTAKT
jgi:hypothetical protein